MAAIMATIKNAFRAENTSPLTAHDCLLKSDDEHAKVHPRILSDEEYQRKAEAVSQVAIEIIKQRYDPELVKRSKGTKK